SWGRMDYMRDLVDIRVVRALKGVIVISFPALLEMVSRCVLLRKQGETPIDGFQTVQWKDFCGPLVNKKGTVALEEDNRKPTDDLVDDIHKKMKAHPKKTLRKTNIWSGRKADYPKRNVVFSPERRFTTLIGMLRILMTLDMWSRK
nr:hypothetical protein [Tanacetum cinerariifolium]